MYEQLLEQATQLDDGSDEPQQPDYDQIFIQAANGKNKKKRIYGTGSLSQSKFSDVGSSSTVLSDLNENPVIQEITKNKIVIRADKFASGTDKFAGEVDKFTNSRAGQRLSTNV